MDFWQVVMSRRSVREYQPEPVPRAALERIVQAGIEAPTGVNAQLKQYVIVDAPELMARIGQISRALTGAPACIVLLVDPKPTKFGEFWVQDASAAMQNMLLAAVDAGYASCWVEGAVRRAEAQLRELLGVPEGLRVWSLMPVGKPAVVPGRPVKPTLHDVTHYNGFCGQAGL